MLLLLGLGACAVVFVHLLLLPLDHIVINTPHQGRVLPRPYIKCSAFTEGLASPDAAILGLQVGGAGIGFQPLCQSSRGAGRRCRDSCGAWQFSVQVHVSSHVAGFWGSSSSPPPKDALPTPAAPACALRPPKQQEQQCLSCYCCCCCHPPHHPYASSSASSLA